MKTIKLLLVVVAVILTGSISYAGKNTQVNIIPQEEKKCMSLSQTRNPAVLQFLFWMIKETRYITSGSLKKLKTNRKLFDFSKLREGRYTIKLNTKDTVIEKEMAVTGTRVMTTESSEMARLK